MRIAAVTALVVLTAGCSAVSGTPKPEPAAAPAAGARSATTSAPAAVPGPDASYQTVAAWVRAGTAADTATYGSATTQDGAVTALGGDRAFVSPSHKISCTTYRQYDPALICMVKLRDAPPRPAQGEGNWVGGWIEYGGTEVSVGSYHGDPGPFVRGDGPELAYGTRLALGDSTCRMDSTGLICVSDAAKSAVKLNDSGIATFGCLTQQTVGPKDKVGELYRC